jgi:predicted O-methyltransferase YrrM
LRDAERELLLPVWPTGRNPSFPEDGGHFALPSHPNRPISVSLVEAHFLANLATIFDASVAIEIGTGFGYSTAWLAHGVNNGTRPGAVHTFDDESQGDLQGEGRRVATRLWEASGVSDRIITHRGHSPEALANIDGLRAQVAFIDGDHYGEQPLLDYAGVLPHLADSGCVVFHDVQQKYTVGQAVAQAKRDGFIIVALATSCDIHVAVRSRERLPLVDAAYRLASARLLTARYG